MSVEQRSFETDHDKLKMSSCSTPFRSLNNIDIFLNLRDAAAKSLAKTPYGKWAIKARKQARTAGALAFSLATSCLLSAASTHGMTPQVGDLPAETFSNKRTAGTTPVAEVFRTFSTNDFINLNRLTRVGDKPAGTSDDGGLSGIYKDPDSGKSYYVKSSNFLSTLIGSSILNAFYPQGTAKDSIAVYTEEDGRPSYYIASETLEGFQPSIMGGIGQGTRLEESAILCSLQNFLGLASRHERNNGVRTLPDGTRIASAIDYDRTFEEFQRSSHPLTCRGIEGIFPPDMLLETYRRILTTSVIRSAARTVQHIHDFLKDTSIGYKKEAFNEESTHDRYINGLRGILSFIFQLNSESRKRGGALFLSPDQLAETGLLTDGKALNNALEDALRFHDLDTAQHLLKTGLTTDQKTLGDALSSAAQGGYEDIVDKLLGTGLITDQQYLGKALLYAAQNKYGEITVDKLLGTGLITDQQILGDALFSAAQRGSDATADHLLKTGLITDQQILGDALLYAAQNRSGEITVDKLLKTGLITDQQYLGKALLYAAQRGYADIVDHLLKTDLITNQQYLEKALFSAAQKGYAGSVGRLLKTGLITDQQILGDALFSAAQRGSDATADHLLKTGLITDQQYLEKALSSAAQRGCGDIVDKLLGTGLITDQQILGDALFSAAQRGYGDIVDHLLKTDLITDQEILQDAVLYAVPKGHHESAFRLLENIALITDRDFFIRLLLGMGHETEALDRLLKMDLIPDQQIIGNTILKLYELEMSHDVVPTIKNLLKRGLVTDEVILGKLLKAAPTRYGLADAVQEQIKALQQRGDTLNPEL